jgi:hypothetical protein
MSFATTILFGITTYQLEKKRLEVLCLSFVRNAICLGRMFGAGNALVDVVDANANVLAVSFVMLRVKVVIIVEPLV